jgi:hypothetical protein
MITCEEGTPQCSETREKCLAKSNDTFEYTWYEPGPNECCGTCNKTEKPVETCSLKILEPKILRYNNCYSKEELPTETCTGPCETYENNSINFQGMVFGEKVCKCCSAEKTYSQQVIMICDGVEVPAEYTRISKCKCNQCGDAVSK